MLFHSYFFILFFLPLCLFGYFLLNKLADRRFSLLFLLGMSLWFYSSMNLLFLPVLAASICLNFFGGRYLRKTQNRLFLVLLLCLNIGALLYFKYTNFFIDSFNSFFSASVPLLPLLLPLGICFFSFQQSAYLVDCSRGETERYSFLEYAAYISFFPYVMSGPIALHDEIIPQFREESTRRFQWEHFAPGLMAFAFGLFKKVLLASTLGKAADWGFASISGMNSFTALAVMLSYTLQLYFDFSGYCDMASGIGLMLNIKLPQNFDSPYRAMNISEFWKRWHITLTRFFTRYLYFPLGGNRRGSLKTYRNILIVFLISGLWHGANWTFLLWGLLHGAAQVFHRLFKTSLQKLHPAFAWLLTFSFVNVAWVFFRVDSVAGAAAFLKNILRCDFGKLSPDFTARFSLVEFSKLQQWLGITNERWHLLLCLVILCFGLFASVQLKNTDERIRDFRPRPLTLAATILLLFWSLISLSGVSSFLYFTF